jgi:PleD family two-component response regulator
MEQVKLLIADDQIENLQLLVKIFNQEGYEIIATRNGEEALNMAQKELPDIALLDINMPRLNGYEVCKILKSDDATRDIATIFISAQNSSAEESYGLSIGAVDYITKPFVVEIVKQRVKIHAELKQLKQKLADCQKKLL